MKATVAGEWDDMGYVEDESVELQKWAAAAGKTASPNCSAWSAICSIFLKLLAVLHPFGLVTFNGATVTEEMLEPVWKAIRGGTEKMFPGAPYFYVGDYESETANKLQRIGMWSFQFPQKPLKLFSSEGAVPALWVHHQWLVLVHSSGNSEHDSLFVYEAVLKHEGRLDTLRKIAALETAVVNTESREPIPEDVRMFVYRRDGGACVKCGANEDLEFDHIIPHSKGGATSAGNLQILCRACNRKKSDLT